MIFELILVSVVILTGLVTLYDRIVFLRFKKVNSGEYQQGIIREYCVSFFPVLLLVLVFRSFLADPWRIPSGSMKPTLLEGDFIVVNKFKYGLRLPVVGTKVLEIGTPERGDIVVFKNKKLGMVMIKRVVGIPGDHIQYSDNKLFVNDKEMLTNNTGIEQDHIIDYGVSVPVLKKEENLLGVKHDIYVREGHGDMKYNIEDIVVPEGHYFMVGDNRNNSNDSRYWGLVSENDLLGKALLTVLSWDNTYKDIRWSRFGKVIK
ncbi:MAG: signal peptidase I [Francisellaceae bacterium]|jgi:signal peptidase I|nr:signal peptidase I [Francisellaceae bacterium]MBT6539039.1 signal peptidase I [Francisellaceae bacterium]